MVDVQLLKQFKTPVYRDTIKEDSFLSSSMVKIFFAFLMKNRLKSLFNCKKRICFDAIDWVWQKLKKKNGRKYWN